MESIAATPARSYSGSDITNGAFRNPVFRRIQYNLLSKRRICGYKLLYRKSSADHIYRSYFSQRKEIFQSAEHVTLMCKGVLSAF